MISLTEDSLYRKQNRANVFQPFVIVILHVFGFMFVDFIFCLLFWQVACVQLINALVSTPDDLDFRLHLRNEFAREGLNEPLQVHT